MERLLPYDEVTAWNEEEGEQTEAAQDLRSEGSVAGGSMYETAQSRISRKEADKVVAPNWPQNSCLEFWKSQMTSNIVAASGDLDHDAWRAWSGPTFAISRDVDGTLANSDNLRFHSIGVKLASALMALMQKGGEQAREVLNDAGLKMAKSCRGSTPTIMKGRHLLAMIVDSFTSASNTDLVYTIRHLFDLPYSGDNDINTFKSQLNEVLECMRPGNAPNDIALRGILYDKIKGSKMMVKAPSAPPVKNDVAAPVLAGPKAKQHAKGKGKGKNGRGKSRDRTRSPSAPKTAAEKKKIPCRFHLGNGTACNKEKDCEFRQGSSLPPFLLRYLKVTLPKYPFNWQIGEGVTCCPATCGLWFFCP